MKKSPLVIYCIIYLLISLGEALYSIINIEFSISIIIRLIVTIALCVFLWGYSNNRAILDAGTWRTTFYFFASLYSFLAILSFISIDTSQIYKGLISTLTAVPVLYCLYLYSDSKQGYWLTDENK